MYSPSVQFALTCADHGVPIGLTADRMPDGGPVTATAPDPQRRPAIWRRSTVWPALIGCALVAITLVGLRGRLPSVSSVTHALRAGALSWVLIAAVCEAIV